ncbi:stage II sporulation protein R [Clostridium cavendishii DSM 21758]|uniref:Stage II sporulation protein R n=1 Tax=Clostridium cavendishii DSM 21758 TaxID=1121302 RepID=A0A1M6U676_9CLOT|nr:stage II sporulation protein R [Clostridium cavendishii]SHK64669.1 stage II sporulation protein R [Clostridium cavendishii DSM 21758]
MKKIIICALSIIILVTSTMIVLSLPVDSNDGQTYKENTEEDISNKLIRFHVIANSDKDEDQNLKLKVRDGILKYIEPKLKDSKSIEESRKILKKNNDEILAIASSIIKSNGYNYKVKSTLDRENFPEKTYGNITLPQGEYEAYRVLIGSASGKNWWCVMFPPLCFVDITKGQVAYKETENQMKKVLNNAEYEKIDNTKEKTKKDKKINFRFKIVDKIKELIDKK